MMKHHNIVALALCLSCAGCANWDARYTNTGEHRTNSIRRNPGNVPVAIVEFSELGSYHDHTQIEQAVELISNTPDPLVVTYIHGWHHSADETDNDRTSFLRFVNSLARSRSVQRYNVVGVYLGWNGQSWNVPVVNSLTIWDRKAAAERLADNGDCLEAMLRIAEASRFQRDGSPRKRHHNFFLGHSLGGLILERAVAHTLLDHHYNGGTLPWDLAVTLNSAADAVLTRQLMASLATRYERRNGNYVRRGLPGTNDGIPENRPRIVSLTADNDKATRLLFPIGAAFTEIGQWRWPRVKLPDPNGRPRELSELKFHRSTPGNNPFLVNFHLKDVTDQYRDRTPANSTTAFDANLATDIENRMFWTNAPQDFPQKQPRHGEAAARQWTRWQFTAAPGDEPDYCNGPDVPYWNVRVNNLIINNHSGIWSENTTAMLAAIFRMHVPLRQNASPSSPPRDKRLQPPVETERMLNSSGTF